MKGLEQTSMRTSDSQLVRKPNSLNEPEEGKGKQIEDLRN